MKKLTILAFIVLLVASCNQKSELNNPFSSESDVSTSSEAFESFSVDEDMEFSPPQSPRQENSIDPPVFEKGSKIIKEGSMRIEVEELTEAKAYIDSLLTQNRGYYEKEVFKNSEYHQNYSLKLRIPSSNFAALVKGLEQGGGTILEKFVNAKDVTEEYLDLEIRLDNNRAYLERYKELLKKAKSIKDMIEIQEKIRHIEMLIDGGLGRMKYLNDKAKYSTLNIELTTKPKEYVAQAPPTFLEDIIEAFKRGFSGVLYFVLVLANLWPILFGIFIIWLFRTKLFRKLSRKIAV